MGPQEVLTSLGARAGQASPPRLKVSRWHHPRRDVLGSLSLPSVNRGAVALLPPSTWVIGGERPCPERHAIPSPCSVSGSRRVAPPSAGPSDRTTDAATQWSTSPPSNCGGCDSASPPLPQLGGEVLGVAERRLPRRAEARAGLTLLGGVGWCRPGRPSAAGQCRGDLPARRIDPRCPGDPRQCGVDRASFRSYGATANFPPPPLHTPNQGLEGQ